MSDSTELDDIEGGESPESSSAPKKKKGKGLGALLPTILKFAAIGIGALIFIVTISVVTYNIMNSGGKTQTTVVDPSSPYIGTRPIYSYYTEIGSVTTRTSDATNYTVTVELNLGYDQNDTAASSELSNRRFQLREFVRLYFAGKTAEQLQGTDKELRLKQEIREMLNTRYLDTARIRDVNIARLDVVEVF